MKACVLEEINKIEYKEVEIPQIADKQVLLKIKACGICSSDIDRIYLTGTYSFPTIPGHEIAGEIVKVGISVDNALIGKKAAVFPIRPCMECEQCRAEEYQRCENYNYYGSRCDGGFAEYIVVDEWNLVFYKDIVDEEAALCEPIAVALHAVKRAQLQSSDIVLIIGTGIIGFLVALWAKEKGAKRVVIIGRNNKKRDKALKLGVEYYLNKDNSKKYLNEFLDNKQATCIFECVGSLEALDFGINNIKNGGKVVCLGNPSGDILLKRHTYWRILRGEISLIGSWNSSYGEKINDWKEVIYALENKVFNISTLISKIYKLEEYQIALCDLKKKNSEIQKIILMPH